MATVEKPDNLRTHWKCMLACTLVSMCPFQYGIDFGIISGIQAMPGFLEIFGYRDPSVSVGWNLQHERQQLISSLMILGAFLSSLAVGPIAKFAGRKLSIWIGCALCMVANIVMMTTTSIGVLYFARLLIGIANGMLMTFSQLYLQECAPPQYRGLVLGLFQTWTSIGSLVGTIVNRFTESLPGRRCYVEALGIVFIVPGLLSILLFWIPESPRWLLLLSKDEKAERAFLWLRPYPEKVPEEMAEVKEAIEAEIALSNSAAFIDVFKNPVDRRRTLLSIAAVSLQAASGAMYMISYGTYFFEMANIGSPFTNACILVAVGIVAILINSCIITRYGRRRVFLFIGLCLCGITQLIVALVYRHRPGTVETGKVIVGLSVVYIVGYNGMIATYAWLSGGELPSQRLRSYTFGLAAGVGFLGAWLATFTAPYFINPDSLNWGPQYGFIWAPSCAIAAIWVYFYLPEVKNRKFEEIDEMFEARLPARAFRHYRCVGVAAVAARDSAEAEKQEKKEKKSESIKGRFSHDEGTRGGVDVRPATGTFMANEKAAAEATVNVA